MALTTKERERLTSEQTDLQRKVEKRRGEPGFAHNVDEMDQRISEIETLLAAE